MWRGLMSLALRLLKLFNHLFIPFAINCKLVDGRVECDDFSPLDRHLALTEEVFKSYGDSIKHIALHTEYQAPLWPLRPFIERYSEYTRRLAELAAKQGVESIELELHPGFVDDRGGRRPLRPIVLGMADYVEGVYEACRGLRVRLNVGVESRGSSVLRRPQAAAYLHELLELGTMLRDEVERRGLEVDVGLIIDPMQLVSLKRARERPVLIDEIFSECRSFIEDHAEAIHGLHLHWLVERGGRLITHYPPPKSEIEWCLGLMGGLIEGVRRRRGVYVVPEVTKLNHTTVDFITKLATLLDHGRRSHHQRSRQSISS